MGVELEVNFDYTPLQRYVLCGGGSASPGYEAEITVNRVVHLGEDISVLLESQFDKIQDYLLSKVEEEHQKMNG